MKFIQSTLLFIALSVFTNSSAAETIWSVEPDFRDKKARKDISGAACSPSQCIAVNDETNDAQFFTLNAQGITPGASFTLSADKNEIDAEAVAYSKGAFYVTGSHGLSRKKGKKRATSFQVLRISGHTVTASNRLNEAIKTVEPLSEYSETRLDENGVNIEGITAIHNRLFFGFRGPSINGDAFMLELRADALFSADDPLLPVLHRISLGPNKGIRDMARTSDGLLILSGPVNKEPKTYQIVFWSEKTTDITRLATLADTGKGKPEGLLLLKETGNAYHVLIFSDGLKNGAPFSLQIAKQ